MVAPKGLLMMSQIIHNRWTKTLSMPHRVWDRFPNPSYFETLKHVSTHDTNLILDMYLIRHHSFDKLLMQHKIDSINCITSCTYKKMRMLNLTQSVTYKWKNCLQSVEWKIMSISKKVLYCPQYTKGTEFTYSLR